MANFFKCAVTAFKGACMGAADVIPGVSGGTIAFLMGIYGELLDSIKSVNGEAFKLLFKGKIAAFWKHVNGTFLASLFVGILISVFSLARLMKYLLEFHPIPLWSFFFGLILASAIYILKGLDKWSVQNIISLVAGIIIAAFICIASPAQTPDELWFIFLSGADPPPFFRGGTNQLIPIYLFRQGYGNDQHGNAAADDQQGKNANDYSPIFHKILPYSFAVGKYTIG